MENLEAVGQAQPQGNGAEHKKDKVITIYINTRPREVSETELSFVEIVRLAFPDAVFSDQVVYTVTYKRGQGNKPEGSLVGGESVKLKDKEIFNVTRTDRS